MTLRSAIRFVLQTIGLITVIGFVGGTIGMLLIGNWLQKQPPIEKADFIVPLAGEDNRLITAVELFKQGYAPKILLSNADVQPPTRFEKVRQDAGHPYMHPYQIRRDVLDQLGVPRDATAEFGNGHISTKQEAESLRAFVGDRPVRIILVTSPFHAWRAARIFEDVLPQATFFVATTPEYKLADPWWSEQASAQLTMSEIIKFVFFWLGGVFRSVGPAH